MFEFPKLPFQPDSENDSSLKAPTSTPQETQSPASTSSPDCTSNFLARLQTSSHSLYATLEREATKAAIATSEATQNASHRIQQATGEINTMTKGAAAVVAVSSGAIVSREVFNITRNLNFQSLPPNLSQKFARAGVREGVRNIQEATKVFETIPAQIRAQGSDAVREFCRDKDWSHIQSHLNGGSDKASNGIFENFRINRARGRKNMTPEELAAAQKVLSHAAFKASLQQVFSAALKGALVSAAIELVFSILENSLLLAQSEISQDEFVERVAAATVGAGLAGGVVTALLMIVAMMFPPLAGLLGIVSVPLALAGIGLMSHRAWEILVRANRQFGIVDSAQEMLTLAAS